jgi:predicted amidophosphoribosyltransferase
MAAHSGGRGFMQHYLHAQQGWSAFINLLFPPRCDGCGTTGSLWCETCRAAINPAEPPWCEKCGEPNTPARLCSKCRAHLLEIEQIRSVALFLGPLRHGVHRFNLQ